ncbi:MAG TPA: baseplate J/gp47 family protein, partial [Kofleriaceae bacterium]|nr:baseplate J/gp47 family protein [Kofleriaceae bacterium]
RAVAVADYEVLARRAPGADIRRARAIGGLHPRFIGTRIPGVVGVFVVGAARDDGQPPIPTEATLHAVSDYLSSWAPRGAEVVAVAPTFHSVRVEASFELAARVDVTETIHDVSRKVDRWFDPVNGADGEGWPFGGTIYADALIRFLLRELTGRGLAVPRLLFVVVGVRSRHCVNVPIPEHDLLWPAPHELVALPRRTP